MFCFVFCETSVKLLLGEFQKLKLISFSVLSQFVVGVGPHPREEAVEHFHDVGTFYFHQMMFTNFFCPVPRVLWGRGGLPGHSLHITELQTNLSPHLAGWIFLIEGSNQIPGQGRGIICTATKRRMGGEGERRGVI